MNIFWKMTHYFQTNGMSVSLWQTVGFFTWPKRRYSKVRTSTVRLRISVSNVSNVFFHSYNLTNLKIVTSFWYFFCVFWKPEIQHFDETNTFRENWRFKLIMKTFFYVFWEVSLSLEPIFVEENVVNQFSLELHHLLGSFSPLSKHVIPCR